MWSDRNARVRPVESTSVGRGGTNRSVDTGGGGPELDDGRGAARALSGTGLGGVAWSRVRVGAIACAAVAAITSTGLSAWLGGDATGGGASGGFSRPG